MRETETSAPSLVELSEAATQGPWTAGTPGHGSVYAVYSDDGTGSIIGMFQHRYVFHRTHQQMIDNAQFVARLVSDYRAGCFIDPTTMAEAVASARAEGVKEGLERAAAHHDEWQARNTRAGCPGTARRHGKYAAGIRALIPGGSSDV